MKVQEALLNLMSQLNQKKKNSLGEAHLMKSTVYGNSNSSSDVKSILQTIDKPDQNQVTTESLSNKIVH